MIAWLHGGDFSSGSPSELDPFQLVLKQKVVVVTIAYRLNIFGFFTSVDGEAPGNFGLMDQSAALLWIKTNIKLFGGNPSSVTLMGQGSGGVSVGLHLTSGEWSDGMFHRAIIMSGNALYDAAVRSPQSYVSSVDMTATAFGCFRRPTAQLMTCLRNVPAQILSDSSPIMDWGPVMDDGMSNTTTPFIRQFPRLLAGSGMLKSIPLLIGHTNMEEVLDFVGEISEGMSTEMYDNVLNEMILNELALVQYNDTMCGNNQLVVEAVNFMYRPYPPTDNQSALRDKLIQYNTERKFAAPTILLANQMSKQSDVYMYRFDMKARTMAVLGGYPEWIGVPHKFDLLFVWGLPYWAVLPNNTQWDATDKRISEIIMTLFMNFAKYGNPTQTGVYIRWEKFTANDPGILIVDRAFNMSDRTNMNFAAYQFWNDFYPRVMSFAAACCNATDSGRPLVIAMSFVNHLLIAPIVVGLTSAILLNQFSFV